MTPDSESQQFFAPLAAWVTFDKVDVYIKIASHIKRYWGTSKDPYFFLSSSHFYFVRRKISFISQYRGLDFECKCTSLISRIQATIPESRKIAIVLSKISKNRCKGKRIFGSFQILQNRKNLHFNHYVYITSYNVIYVISLLTFLRLFILSGTKG